jgi:hypothetical protein
MDFLFSIPVGSVYHFRINMFQNGIDPNNNSGVQIFSHLDIHTQYPYLTGDTILIPTGRYL